jgi:hypothetical protein
MERVRDGFIETNCQPEPLMRTPIGCGQGASFHPPGRGADVGETSRGSGQASLGGGGVDCLNTFAQYYLHSSPTTQPNIFYHFSNDQNYSQ